MLDNKIKQIKLLHNKSRSALESEINDALVNIFEEGGKDSDIRVWNYNNTKNGLVYWNCSIEYTTSPSELIEDESRKKQEFLALRSFNYDSTKSLSEIGYHGAKAFVVQNDLDIDIDMPYHNIMNEVEDKYDFNRTTATREYSPDIETIDVDINLDNGND